jgi:hypothetical protein
MARLDAPENMNWFGRLIRWAAARKLGNVPEPVAITASNSAVLFGATMMELAQERARSLPVKVKTLADLRAATRIGCPW